MAKDETQVIRTHVRNVEPKAPVMFFQDIQKEQAKAVETDIKVSADGKIYTVPQAVANTARDAFRHLIQGNSQFKTIEPELSAIFGAPLCYTDRDAPGRQGLELALKASFPALSYVDEFIAAQDKLSADERDAVAYGMAIDYQGTAKQQVQQRIGFLYQAWKRRVNPQREAPEVQVPNEYIKLVVLPKLQRMSKADNQTPADQRTARFWYNWLTFAVEHKKDASAMLVKAALDPEYGLAQPRTVGKEAQKPGAVRTIKGKPAKGKTKETEAAAS